MFSTRPQQELGSMILSIVNKTPLSPAREIGRRDSGVEVSKILAHPHVYALVVLSRILPQLDSL